MKKEESPTLKPIPVGLKAPEIIASILNGLIARTNIVAPSIVGFQCAMEKGSNLWSAATLARNSRGRQKHWNQSAEKNTDTENRTRAKMIQYMP